MSFTECLKKEYGYQAYAPYSGTEFDLLTGEFVYEAEPVALKKKAKAVSDVFARLVAAGQRLLSVIQKCEGRPNKELGKFADQINSLCNKWEN